MCFAHRALSSLDTNAAELFIIQGLENPFKGLLGQYSGNLWCSRLSGKIGDLQALTVEPCLLGVLWTGFIWVELPFKAITLIAHIDLIYFLPGSQNWLSTFMWPLGNTVENAGDPSINDRLRCICTWASSRENETRVNKKRHKRMKIQRRIVYWHSSIGFSLVPTILPSTQGSPPVY